VRYRSTINIALIAANLFFQGIATTRCYADSSPNDTVEYLVNPALVQSLSEAPKDLMAKHPYVAHFRKDGMDLFMVATLHESKPGNETFKVINRVLNQFRFKRIIVEGCRNAAGEIHFDEFKNLMRPDKKRGVYPGGERGFAMELAHEKGISVIGGEPTYKELAEAVLAAGFKWEDVLGVEFIKIMSPGFRKVQNDKRTASELFKQNLGYMRREMQAPDSVSFELPDFYAWFEQHTGEKFDPEKVEINKFRFTPAGKYIEKISVPMDKERNQFLAKTISIDLLKYKRVLVVYGNGHYACLRKALEAGMGKPVHEGDLSKD
jgi:hypothetical protein